MPTQAISSFGVQLRLGNGVALAPFAVSGGTATTPIVLTTATHGIPVGDVDLVTVAGVTGLTGANGTWVAQALSTTTLRLRGSVGGGAYSSGGTVTRTDTYTTIAEVTNIADAGIDVQTIDVTAHDSVSGYGSSIPTFLRGSTMRVTYNLVPAHPTHDAVTGLLSIALSRLSRRFLIVFPDAAKTAWAFAAFVGTDRSQMPVAGALTSEAALEVDGAMLLAA